MYNHSAAGNELAAQEYGKNLWSRRMNDDNRRRSIWDMNILDTTIYLILFIGLMMPGMVYNIWYRFIYQQAATPDQISALTKDVGQIGFSAAALGFAIIVMRRGIMALIDWPSKEKYRAEGRTEGIAEGLAVGRVEGRAEGHAEGRTETQGEWMRWNQRRVEAERRGERFDEPPPGA